MLEVTIYRFGVLEDGIVDFGFRELGHLTQHQIILGVLKEDLNCKVTGFLESPTDIYCTLCWNDIEFEFNHHYMLGNIIRTVPEHADELWRFANQAANIINEKIERAQMAKSSSD